MPIGALDTGAPERDPVQHRDVVADDSRLSHHDARAVVYEHALAELGAGVDVYLELLVHLCTQTRTGTVGGRDAWWRWCVWRSTCAGRRHRENAVRVCWCAGFREKGKSAFRCGSAAQNLSGLLGKHNNVDRRTRAMPGASQLLPAAVKQTTKWFSELSQNNDTKKTKNFG